MTIRAMIEKKTAQIVLKVKPSTKNKLMKAARKHRRSVNWYCEELLLEALRQKVKIPETA